RRGRGPRRRRRRRGAARGVRTRSRGRGDPRGRRGRRDVTRVPAGAPLADRDVLLVDLDGVVYAAAEPIPHAVDALNSAQAAGLRLGYVTNNASRTDVQVADQLRTLGLQTAPTDVITSPQAALDL